jgi:DNA-binding transcriptional LysR family regulator
MRTPATPSIDQLLVLLAVAEAGSFTAAAKRLGRATSAVSYAMDALEDQLGLSLFDRGTTRKPKLTPQGEAIVSEAKAIAQGIDVLRARVKGLREELEPEVSVVVDSLYPNGRIVTLLQEFHSEFPTVPIRLYVQALGGVERAVRSGIARIGVGSGLHIDLNGLQRIDIPGVRMIAVAAPGHPLATAKKGARALVRDFVHLVLTEQPHGNGQDFGVNVLNNWRIGDLSAKHQLILGGIGWGGLPEPMVRADIEAGRLVQLNVRDWRGGEYTMLATYKTDSPPGRAGQWLIDRMVTLSDAPQDQTPLNVAIPVHPKRHRRKPRRSAHTRRR